MKIALRYRRTQAKVVGHLFHIKELSVSLLLFLWTLNTEVNVYYFKQIEFQIQIFIPTFVGSPSFVNSQVHGSQGGRSI